MVPEAPEGTAKQRFSKAQKLSSLSLASSASANETTVTEVLEVSLVSGASINGAVPEVLEGTV